MADAQPALRTIRLAGLPRRLAAVVYESLLVGAVIVAVGFLLLPVIGPSSPNAASPSLYLPSRFGRAASFGVIFLVCGGYCVWLWSGKRRTLPMKTWGLVMRSAGGAPVGASAATLRYVAWWIGPALALVAYAALGSPPRAYWLWPVACINYAWALLDRDRQFLHDRIAGTRIVFEPRPPSSPPP